MADGCYGILFSTMLRRKSPLGRFQRQGESYYARPFGRAFSSVPQDVARQKWLFGVGGFRNAAAKRSSITIRGSDSQRASLARATKIPGISAPWRRYCISDGFFPSLPSPLTRASSPPFVLGLALRSTSLSLSHLQPGHMQGDVVYWIFMTYTCHRSDSISVTIPRLAVAVCVILIFVKGGWFHGCIRHSILMNVC